jgi:cell division protein FtsL
VGDPESGWVIPAAITVLVGVMVVAGMHAMAVDLAASRQEVTDLRVQVTRQEDEIRQLNREVGSVEDDLDLVFAND